MNYQLKNKIKIKRHALERFNERLYFTTTKKDLETLIYNNSKKIKNAPKQKHIKINVKFRGIPCIIVVYKSLSYWNVITIYINRKTKKGKRFLNRIKEFREEKDANKEKSNLLHGK